ncbi:hypothetical protein ACIQUB_26470, partial [Rhizobium sp. NPDC090275]|uniref:hypothetical protein n=1 Tax=Rhizobium sp. NPDC090275 TaxID=3364498 RepID=UPI00383B20CE
FQNLDVIAGGKTSSSLAMVARRPQDHNLKAAGSNPASYRSGSQVFDRWTLLNWSARCPHLACASTVSLALQQIVALNKLAAGFCIPLVPKGVPQRICSSR